MSRPNYARALRERLAAVACEPGVSVAKPARENGINANMLLNGGSDVWPSGKLSLLVPFRSYC
jgi:transposase-like protein